MTRLVSARLNAVQFSKIKVKILQKQDGCIAKFAAQRDAD